MKNFLKLILCGVILLVIPVLLWNVWFLDYIDQNGKLFAWISDPIFALLGTIIMIGTKDILLPIKKNGIWNPFYGWFFVSLIIESAIVLLSNT